jgi:hypothetical protein
MKNKIKKTFACLLTLCYITGCSSNAATSSNVQSSSVGAVTESIPNNKNANIAVDKGLLDVKITLPSSLFGEKSHEDITANAKTEGVKDVKFNDDGSITYKMSKSDYKKFLEKTASSIHASMQDIINDKKTNPSVVDITCNDTFTEFNVLVDAEKYSPFESIVFMAFYIQGFYYQSINGVREDERRVVINIKNSNSNEIINTMDSNSMKKNSAQ